MQNDNLTDFDFIVFKVDFYFLHVCAWILEHGTVIYRVSMSSMAHLKESIICLSLRTFNFVSLFSAHGRQKYKFDLSVYSVNFTVTFI